MAQFEGVPSGVDLYVTTGPIANASVAAGDAVLLTTDSNGAGEWSPAPSNQYVPVTVNGAPTNLVKVAVANGRGVAVWEVVKDAPLVLQSFDFGVVASYSGQPVSTVAIYPRLGPSSTAAAADSTSPLPRFGGGATANYPGMPSIQPASGSGASQTFVVKASDADGYQGLYVTLYLTSDSDRPRGCLVNVSESDRTVTLENDDGVRMIPTPIGSAVTLENSLCALDVQGVTLSGVGTELTVQVPLTFRGSFAGVKNLGVEAFDGFRTRRNNEGSWTVTGANSAPEARAVTPASGSGAGQTFAFSFYDADGYGDIQDAQLLIGTALSARNTCYLYFNRASRLVWLANDAGTWTGPVTLGAAATLQNSQCTLHAQTWSETVLTQGYTVNLTLSFAPAYSGEKSIFALVSDRAGLDSGWSRLGAWTVSGNHAPTSSSVSPSSGSREFERFTFVLSDSDGYADIRDAQLLIGSALTSVGTCYMYYSRPSNQVWLASDAGNWTGPALLGGASELQNSQCTVNAAASSASGSGADLSVSLAIVFSGSYAGNKAIFMQASDMAGESSSWRQHGTWRVPGPTNLAPSTVSVTPGSGSGASAQLAFAFSDGNGYLDLVDGQFVIGSALASQNSCYLYVNRRSNQIWLANDAGSWTGPVAFGSSATLQNSQCTLAAVSSSAVGNGNNWTVTLSLSFAPGYAGVKNLYMLSSDLGGANTTWRQMGTYTVTSGVANSTPATPTVSPASGGGASSVFTFTFADADGYADVASAQLLIGSALSPASACYLYFERATNRVWLANDAGTWTGPIAVQTAGALQNSQCAIAGANSSVTATGTTLLLQLSVSFQPAFAGAKTIWAYVEDKAGAHVGWAAAGTWNVPAVPVNQTPQVVWVGPGAGSDFAIVLSDADGYSDLSSAEILVGSALSPANSCYLYYERVSNRLWLAGDAGSWGPAAGIGAPGMLENSQCTVWTQASVASAGGSSLTLNLHITSTAAYSGNKTLFALVRDKSGASSGWRAMTNWTLP
jgi:hypothetical protein